MMKLRQLVANSLPMGRNRKKKDKEKQQGAAATKATSPSSVYNGNYHVPFPKRHRSPVPAPPPKLPDNHNPGVVKTPPQKSTYTDEELELITEMRNIKMVDHKPTSPLSPMSPSIDKTMDYSLNFNLNSSDSKFSCYKHIHSTYSSKSDRQSYDDRLSTFVPHGKKNTLQRHSFSPEPPTYARHMKTPERQVYTPDHYITSPTFSHHDCISVTSGNRHSAPESHYSHEKPELHYSVSPALDSNSDINSNSLTRPRTRIKTNPWLPSPRGSSTSSNSSPAYSPTDMYSPIAGKTFPQEAIYEEIPGCKESPVHYNIKPSHWVGSHTSDGQSDTDSLQRSQVSESDNSLMSWSADCPPSYERSLRINSMDEENDDEDDKMEELTLSMKDDYKDPDILEMKDSQNDDDIKDTSDTKSITSKVSFHYEEVFESKMEDDCDNLSSNESLSDGYGSDDEDDVFLASGACSLVTSVSDVNSLDSASLSKVSAIVSDYDEDMSDAELDVWQIRQDSSADTDDTICEYEGEYDLQSSMITEPTPPRIRRFPRCSPRPGSSSPSDSPRSSTSKTLEEDSNHPNEPLEPLGCGVVDANDNDVTSDSAPKMLLSKLSDVSSLDSGADSGLYSMDSVSLDRSVGEVRSSLQDKVTKLRQDKLLVDEKIRQAQEEDRIRMQEKMRFQKQVTQHRKQMLLSTLQDLKMKLENQSQRLQTTYSSVLHMQKHMIRQRKHMSAHEISAADAQEAPF